MPTTSVINLKGMAANNIDSDQYVDGSIDAVHLSANSVDSDSYVDASIDLAHMSSESVDEDNLHISNAGSNGQFLSKQSGDAGGLTWAAAGGSGFEFIATTNASGASSIDFEPTATGYTISDYTQLLVILTSIYPVTASQQLWIRTDSNDGASYQATGYTHWWGSFDDNGATEYVNANGNEIIFTPVPISTSGVVNYAFQAELWFNLYGAAGAAATRSNKVHFRVSSVDAANDFIISNGAGFSAGETGPYNSIRIMAASGNITGRATLYGLKVS
jgi:hypothetical protein